MSSTRQMKKVTVIALIIAIFLSVGVASAHRLIIVHRIGEVEIEVYFGGGSACRDANVTVYTIKDGLEDPYLEGITDSDGKFRFSPKVGVNEYKVVVDAVHMPGHRAEETINLTSINAENAGALKEMPTYLRVAAGLGYILGLAGIAIGYKGIKAQRSEGDR